MTNTGADIWTDNTSVLFTSFWGWSPETWGTVGWTGGRGLTRRNNLLRNLSNPFITVVYVTSNKTWTDPKLKGKIAGFYLVSHETGHRDEFTHPYHHDRSPEKWQHSLRALRAFSYLPEHRISVIDFDPLILDRARTVAAMAEILTDPLQIKILRETPWVEVELYTPPSHQLHDEDTPVERGYVRAGPASKEGYIVSHGVQQLKRQLYILKLHGNTDYYMGQPAHGHMIYKIGLSASPDMRRQTIQKSMPRGSFNWHLYQTNANAVFDFDAAKAGEYAMKEYLDKCAEWLGGEFYLASKTDIDKAWQIGLTTAQTFG